MPEYVTIIQTTDGPKAIDYNALANKPIPDTTLAVDGGFADAKSTGDAIARVASNLAGLTPEQIGALPNTYVPPAPTPGAGIEIQDSSIVNAGVRSVVTGETNGTMLVDTNGNQQEVAVCGLKSAAYTDSTDYAPATHTHVNIYHATLLAANWSTDAPYTQDVELVGLLESDRPIADINMQNATVDNAMEYQYAWSCVHRIVANNDNFEAYCYSERPEIDMDIIIQVVR